MLIAGLMSCLMVDESIGDAFIDAAMPSFFSSIYLLANALYNISLLAILCPSGVVLGIFLYYTLVYRRAKKSHKERKILLQMERRNGDIGRKDKLFRQETRRPKGIAYGAGEFTQRLLVSINDGIVTFISYVSKKRLKKRVAVESAFTYNWCAMNKPALHQGTIYSNLGRGSILAIRLQGNFNAKDNDTNMLNPVRKRKVVPNPPEIMRMVKVSHMWWTVHDGHLNSIVRPRVHQPSMIAQSAGHLFRSDYSFARKSHRELRATIFFDAGEALLRIWSNLLITTVHEKGVDYDWKVELFEVPASALLEELQNVFDAFYPDGIPMSEVEKKEACELFSKWIQGQHSSHLTGGMCSDSQMIPFKAFHGWFYDLSEMIHSAMSDRLLTYVLLLSHRSNATSADAVRLLNIIAPKHSNTIYKTYISIRPSSVVAPPLKTMYTENYYFGSPLLSRRWYNRRGHHSIQDIDCQSDDDDLYYTYAQSSLDYDDLYSTYAQSFSEGRLPDSINPMNNLVGSPRNFSYPQDPQEVNNDSKSEDLYCTCPEGVSVENASPSTHPQKSLKGGLQNICKLRDPLRKTPLRSIYPRAPQ